MDTIKMIHGIDTLYYYCETNENYDDIFLDILDQIEEVKGNFEKKYIEYENSDITISINDISLSFLGKAEGYYWFKDINEYFKIGFKDTKSNRIVNDIRVQLQAIGIYTIGIKSLIEFIDKKLLDEIVTGYKPITRADLNTFIQYDFSFLNREMFSTRKRKYATISEIGNAKTLQTIYVGKEPFKLRIYNKKEELKKSSKKDLMYEYFSNSDFDLEDHIFNIEFEMKREHLKQFNIDTVDNLLENAVKLFQISMDDIRLIDLSNITNKDIKNNSKSRAVTLPIWDKIKNSYKLDSFLQTSLPLERIKRKITIYDDFKFKIEMISLIRRAYINNLVIDDELLTSLHDEAKDSLTKTTTKKESKKRYLDIDYELENGDIEHLRQLEDGSVIKPVDVISVNTLGDYDLIKYLDKLTSNKDNSKDDLNLWNVAYKEAITRNLIPIVYSGEASTKKAKS